MSEEQAKTKEQYLSEFIKSIKAAKTEMQVFKDHISDLKKSYVENNWLSKEEIKLAMKAWKLVEDDTDLDQLKHIYDSIK